MKRDNRKIVIICFIIVVILLVAGIVGYIVYTNYQEKITEQVEEIKSKCEEQQLQISYLNLSKNEQIQINEEFAKIQQATESRQITEETSNIIDHINIEIEQIKQSNIAVLVEKEIEYNSIDASKFNEEQISKLQQYQDEYLKIRDKCVYLSSEK